MAVTIVATVGGASANSFLTLAEAQTYMDSRLNESAWESATTDNQNRALVEATRALNVLPWKGSNVDTTQALNWPRQWAINPDVVFFAWSYYATNEIPQRVKDATAELALQFIKAGTTDVAALDPNLGVIEKTVDVITTRWQPWQKPSGLARFPSVMRFIKPLLEGSGAGAAIQRG